jgi:cytochrome c2
LALASIVTAAALAQTSPGTATARDGVYTIDQATKGRASFDDKCATCHDGNMGPELMGSAFMTQWEGKPLRSLYTRIIETMPADNPGSLAEGETVEILAYLLQANEMPAGEKALESTRLDSVTFAGAAAKTSTGTATASPGTATASPGAATASPGTATARDGVYTTEQATKGRTSFDDKCATCHDGNMGPELMGGAFMKQWEGKPLRSLYSRIAETMPADNPGSLPESETLDIMAYLLQANEMPAGEKPLEGASLDTVTFPSAAK